MAFIQRPPMHYINKYVGIDTNIYQNIATAQDLFALALRPSNIQSL